MQLQIMAHYIVELFITNIYFFHIINRPTVGGAVLQSPSSLINYLIHSFINWLMGDSIWKHRQKHDFFVYFWPKKSKVFDILVIKMFFNTILIIFDPLKKFDFFLILEVSKNEIFNIMFYYSFSGQKCHTFCHRSKSL